MATRPFSSCLELSQIRNTSALLTRLSEHLLNAAQVSFALDHPYNFSD